MFGSTLQTIRKSKNMTLKEAAGDIVSISQLSRFENELSMLPVDRFAEVLNNLNTTIEEFDYILGQQKEDEKAKLFRRIEKYNEQDDLAGFRNLISELKDKRPSAYSWDQFMIYFIDSVLAVYEENEFAANGPVLDYLMQVENWGEMELRIYTMLGFIFDIETTYFLMRTALKRSQQYQSLPGATKLLYVILSNNFSVFLAAGHIDYAEETIELFEKNYAENAIFLSPHIDFMFNKGLLAFKKNQIDQAEKYCENAIEICHFFQQKRTAEKLTKRYEDWKANYQDPNFKELAIQLGFFY